MKNSWLMKKRSDLIHRSLDLFITFSYSLPFTFEILNKKSPCPSNYFQSPCLTKTMSEVTPCSPLDIQFFYIKNMSENSVQLKVILSQM